MKQRLKAQLNIDFVSGFFLFILTVAYVAFSITNTFPQYVAQSADNNMKLEAWQASENFMRLAEKNGAIDTSVIGNFSLCIHYDYSNISSRNNYSYVKNALNVSDLNSIHLTFDALFFGITDAGNNTDKSGSIFIAGNAYQVYVRNTSFYFSEARNSTGPWSNESIFLGARKYDIFKIDYGGDFLILRRLLVDCGPNVPAFSANAVVRRYSTYNGSFAVMKLAYW